MLKNEPQIILLLILKKTNMRERICLLFFLRMLLCICFLCSVLRKFWFALLCVGGFIILLIMYFFGKICFIYIILLLNCVLVIWRIGSIPICVMSRVCFLSFFFFSSGFFLFFSSRYYVFFHLLSLQRRFSSSSVGVWTNLFQKP